MQHRRGQRLHVVIGDLARVLDVDFAGSARRHLRLQGAELLAEGQVRSEHGEQLGGERRHVDRRAHLAARQEVDDLLGDGDRDVDLRLVGRGAEVRRATTPSRAQQRVVLRRRLFREDVERGAGDLAGTDRVRERRFVDDAAARAVDDAHPFSSSRTRPCRSRPRVSAVSGVCTEMKSARA